MAAESSCQNIIVHVLDVNDNSPQFLQNDYTGTVSESASLGSYVQMIDDSKKRYEAGLKNVFFLILNDNTFYFSHLALNVYDPDVGFNGMLQYKIIDDLASNLFKIDSTTGAIKTLGSLDYETNTNYSFYVSVCPIYYIYYYECIY